MERKWWSLLAVCLATFMLLLDITVVNVALPDIQKELHTDLTGLQWVVDAYTLTLASFTLTMGALADRFGRRRLFVIGVGLFTLASLLCGLATNATFLHLARGLQGIGGAAMFATSLALIAQEFQGPERGTAIAAWGATIGGAVADRSAGRRGAHRRARLGVDLLRQRPDRDRHCIPRPDSGRRVARSRRQAPGLGRPGHLLAWALRADLRPAAR